jgi:hypothetical protein
MLKRCVFIMATLAAIVAVLPTTGLPVAAQQTRKSPHETISNTYLGKGGGRVTITYGRPYAKDRKIWGGLVPYGKAWRTGADEATILTAQEPLMIGETMIPAGAYTLYTVPEEKGGKLVFSKTVGKWGIPVDEKNDLTRVDMKQEPLANKVEQFTIMLDKSDTGGVIKMQWENAQYSVPFTVVKK